MLMGSSQYLSSLNGSWLKCRKKRRDSIHVPMRDASTRATFYASGRMPHDTNWLILVLGCSDVEARVIGHYCNMSRGADDSEAAS